MPAWLSNLASSDAQPDPRKPGDLCYDAYWRTPYLVLSVQTEPDGYMRSITVLNLADPNQDWGVGTCKITTHMTQWDGRAGRGDQFIDHGRLYSDTSDSETYQDYLAGLRDTCLNWINPITGRSYNSRF